MLLTALTSGHDHVEKVDAERRRAERDHAHKQRATYVRKKAPCVGKEGSMCEKRGLYMSRKAGFLFHEISISLTSGHENVEEVDAERRRAEQDHAHEHPASAYPTMSLQIAYCRAA